MLTGLQKAKVLKELKQLRLDKANLSGLSLAKALKQIKQLRIDLDMGSQSATDTKTLIDEANLQPLQIVENANHKDLKKALQTWLGQFKNSFIITVDLKKVILNHVGRSHLVNDILFKTKLPTKAITHFIEVLTHGEFIERQSLSKPRNDSFVAFHVYRKWVEVDAVKLLMQVKVAELADGTFMAGNGLIVYSVKDKEKATTPLGLMDGLSNSHTQRSLSPFDINPTPHRLTGMRLQGEATDIYHYDEASTFKSQADDYVFIEIVEVIANEQPNENDLKQPNPFFQAVINGEIKFSLQMVSDLLNEVQKDPTAPLVVEATKTAYQAFLDNGYTLDMQDWN